MSFRITSAASSSSVRREASGDMKASVAKLLSLPGLLPAATFLAILVVWEAFARIFESPSFVLPAPSRINVLQ